MYQQSSQAHRRSFLSRAGACQLSSFARCTRCEDISGTDPDTGVVHTIGELLVSLANIRAGTDRDEKDGKNKVDEEIAQCFGIDAFVTVGVSGCDWQKVFKVGDIVVVTCAACNLRFEVIDSNVVSLCNACRDVSD